MQNVDPKTVDNMIVDMTADLGQNRRRAIALAKSGQEDTLPHRSAQDRVNALEEVLKALEEVAYVYAWNRYIVVPDGHIHNERGCSSLYITTVRQFLPDESGNTVGDMIKKYGEMMCTVCYPEAPADPAYKEAVRKSEAERDAARAEKDAVRQAKQDATPKNDAGEPLKVGWDSPKTERSARNALASRQYDMVFYARDGKLHPDHEKWAAESVQLARSIARLEGAENITARSGELITAAAEKAVKKLAADIRKWNRENPNSQV